MFGCVLSNASRWRPRLPGALDGIMTERRCAAVFEGLGFAYLIGGVMVLAISQVGVIAPGSQMLVGVFSLSFAALLFHVAALHRKRSKPSE